MERPPPSRFERRVRRDGASVPSLCYYIIRNEVCDASTPSFATIGRIHVYFEDAKSAAYRHCEP